MLGDTADLSEEEFAETWITRMSGCIATAEAADAAKPRVMFVLGGPGTPLLSYATALCPGTPLLSRATSSP